MAPKKRQAVANLPDQRKKRFFTPLYLRKIPSSSSPGKAPHIATDEAPEIIPDLEDDDDRKKLYKGIPVPPPQPGVGASLQVRIPQMFRSPGPSPLTSPKGKMKAPHLEDVQMEDLEASMEEEESDGEISFEVLASSKEQEIEWKNPDIALRAKEGSVFCDVDVDHKASWEKPAIKLVHKSKPGSPKGKVETSLEGVYTPAVKCQWNEEDGGDGSKRLSVSFRNDPKLHTVVEYEEAVDTKLVAGAPEVKLNLSQGVNIGMELMPDIAVLMRGSSFEINSKHKATRVQFQDMDGEEEEETEFEAQRRKSLKNKRHEIRFSEDGETIVDEHLKVSRDSLLLVAKLFAHKEQLQRKSVEFGPSPYSTFDPENIGSFPPRPPNILLFKTAAKKRKKYRDLNEMEYFENTNVYPVAETMTEPSDFTERQAFTMGKVRTEFNLPLYLFDNPQMDLRYPTIDLKEVSFATPFPSFHIVNKWLNVVGCNHYTFQVAVFFAQLLPLELGKNLYIRIFTCIYVWLHSLVVSSTITETYYSSSANPFVFCFNENPLLYSHTLYSLARDLF